jgi:undecaprenyl diphosphate synthase
MAETKPTIKIPKHIGLIMDGNRRWAKERNLPAFEGHSKGYRKMKESSEWFFSKGVEILTVFAFSTENWNRSRDEVNYLMKLLEKVFRDDMGYFNDRGYKILTSGRTEELPGDLPEICQKGIDLTKNNIRGTLNICLNYGGRAEIVDAVKKMMKNGVTVEQVHEGMIHKYLYNEYLPDPDVIVRTSGEQRLSGFLLWESVYSELIFLNKFWPDFERTDVDFIIEEFQTRQRRFGV